MAHVRTWQAVNLRRRLQDLVCQQLRRRQDVGVVLGDQVLRELLKLLATHL